MNLTEEQSATISILNNDVKRARQFNQKCGDEFNKKLLDASVGGKELDLARFTFQESFSALLDASVAFRDYLAGIGKLEDYKSL